MEQDRFDEKNHWAFFDDKPSRSLCKIKDCHNLTHVFCQKCQVHLCLNQTRNCFHRFHRRDLDLLQIRKKLKISPKPTQLLDHEAPEMSKPIVAAMQPMIGISNRDYESDSSKRVFESSVQSKTTKPHRKPRNSEKPTIKGTVAKKYSLRSTSALLISKRTATRVSSRHVMDSNSGSDESTFFYYLKLKRC